MRQLPLGVQLGVSLRFDTFAVGENGAAVDALRRLADGVEGVPVWIYGPPGAGRSHLLQAACARAGDAGRASAYLPLAQVRADGRVSLDVAHRALELLEVDDHGFDEIGRRLLKTIIEKFGGGPVGVGSLAAALSEERDAIEEIYEPFLIQIGFLDRTPRGRVATARAYDYFGLTAPGKDRLW